MKIGHFMLPAEAAGRGSKPRPASSYRAARRAAARKAYRAWKHGKRAAA